MNKPLDLIIYGQHSNWELSMSNKTIIANLIKRLNIPINVINVKDKQKVTQNHNNQLIIPLMEPHILNYKKYNSEHLFLSILPDKDMINIFSDKHIFSKYIDIMNLSPYAPKTYDKTNVVFPCVFKPINMNASHGVKIINDLEEYNQLINKSEWKGTKHILQSVVNSKDEYVTHCLCKNGEILWHCTYLYTMPTESTIRKPSTTLVKYDIDIKHLYQMKMFLKLYTGMCNVNYKIIDNDVVVLEINPRFGGSLMLKQNEQDLEEALYNIIKNAD